MKGAGLTVTGPSPQSMVTSASTRAVMSATAGLARRIASCTVSAASVDGAPSQITASRTPRSERSMFLHGITECSPCVLTPCPSPSRWAWTRRRAGRGSLAPARAVVLRPLLGREEVARLEVREQTYESHLGPCVLDVGPGRAYRRPVGGPSARAGGEGQGRVERVRVEMSGLARAHHPR